MKFQRPYYSPGTLKLIPVPVPGTSTSTVHIFLRVTWYHAYIRYNILQIDTSEIQPNYVQYQVPTYKFTLHRAYQVRDNNRNRSLFMYVLT